MEYEGRWLDATRLLVGGLLIPTKSINSKIYEEVSGIVAPEHVHPNYRETYHIITEMIAENPRFVNPRTVALRLSKDGDERKVIEEDLTKCAIEISQGQGSPENIIETAVESARNVRMCYAEHESARLMREISEKGFLKSVEEVEQLKQLQRDTLEAIGQGFPSLEELKGTIKRSRMDFIVDRPFPIPLGVLGIIAGMGSVGKSYIALMIALSASSVGMKTLYISLEDPLDKIIYRVDQLMTITSRSDVYSPFQGKEPDPKKIFPLEIDPSPIVDRLSYKQTEFAVELRSKIVTAVKKQGINLVIVDPIAPLIADENNNAYVANFTGFWNSILRELDREVTILLAHHTSKRQIANITETDMLGSTFVRGASALVDNSKFVVQILRLSQIEREYALQLVTELARVLKTTPEEIAGAPVNVRREVVVVFNTKNNYFEPFPPTLITLFPSTLLAEIIMVPSVVEEEEWVF